MPAPFFSIVLPTHNRSALLKRAIDSCLQQSLTDFELIVVDDASTDDTPAVVARFSDPRVRYLRRKSGGGAAAARNSGIRQAVADYVAFLDDDDEYLPRFLEVTAHTLRSAKTPLDFTWCGVRRVHTGPGDRERVEHEVWHVASGRDNQVVGGLVFATRFAASEGFVARRRCLLDLGAFDETMGVSEDLDLLFRLLNRGCAFAAIPEILINVHVHTGVSLSRSYDPSRFISSHERLIRKNETFLRQHKTLWLHYNTALAGHYYRAKDVTNARRVLCSLVKAAPFRGRTWEYIFRYEVLKRFRRTFVPPKPLLVAAESPTRREAGDHFFERVT